MPRHIIAPVSEIPPGGRLIVELDNRSIGIFNVGGRFYAIRNTCPHAGGRLCEGPVSGLVTSERPGEYRYRRVGEIIRCPWHGWEFDLTTGQSWFDPMRTRVRSYGTDVTAGSELVSSVGEEDRAIDAAGYRPGPYRAERYEVEVDRDYVVVHT